MKFFSRWNPSSSVRCALALAALGLVLPAALTAQEAEAWLADYGRASGWEGASVDLVLARGEGSYNGNPGEITLAMDKELRYRFDFGGAMPYLLSSDGESGWERDWMGTPRRLTLREKEEARAMLLFMSGHWWTHRDRFHWRVERIEGQRSLHWTAKDGRFRGSLSLNDENLVESCTFDNGKWLDEIHYLNYRQIDQVHFPAELRIQRPGDEVDTVQFTSISRPQTAAESWFPKRQKLRADFRFDPAVSPKLVCRQAPTGHLLVQVDLGLEEEKWFIFDTGAGASTLSTTVGASLQLQEVGEITAVGIGGRVKTRFVQGPEFRIGPLRIEKSVFLELDLSFLEPVFGVEIAGIIGYGVLSRCVAEVDMVEGWVQLHPSSSYELKSGAWQDLVLYDRHPCVEAGFEGDHRGWFRLDTGAAGSTVMFHTPAVQELSLLQDREVSDGGAGGVGGMLPIKQGRIRWFELAGHRFENPEVGFGVVDKGAFKDAWTLGNIGGDFLKPFRLVLDYQNERIAFQKRSNP
ncbi:MAG: hypothetical protein DWQ01_01345 [Planctomycetota bacterium]|nr:MAG: hypothetical protein DWQ01_01345 [Planctomycetota bacterium]